MTRRSSHDENPLRSPIPPKPRDIAMTPEPQPEDGLTASASTPPEVATEGETEPKALAMAPEAIRAFFAARCETADFAAFDRIVRRAGGEPPLPEDRLEQGPTKRGEPGPKAPPKCLEAPPPAVIHCTP